MECVRDYNFKIIVDINHSSAQIESLQQKLEIIIYWDVSKVILIQIEVAKKLLDKALDFFGR
jgi:hypothetical protein